jgi:uncharacterized protein
MTSEQSDVNQVLSNALKRTVTLRCAGSGHASAVTAEQYWPDIEGFELRDAVTDFSLPTGTFFDCATVHLLTTATLDRLHHLYPRGRFEIARFRPNIVLALGPDEEGFVENAWVGRTISIGRAVRLRVTGLSGRCVMTSLAQGELPRDPGILRTAAQHNGVSADALLASVARAFPRACSDASQLRSTATSMSETREHPIRAACSNMPVTSPL